MGYKWKPSTSQRREFAERMKNPDEALAYEQRKIDKANKKREASSFDYNTAGGEYVPTVNQYNIAMSMFEKDELTNEQINAANNVISAYICQDKTHHDNIHIVNEFERNKHS